MQPLEVREAFPERPLKLELLGLECCESESVRNLAEILERGRIAGRDIGGSDPERMAAPRVEDYVTELFKNSSVTVEVVSDIDTLKKEYPLFAAVNQCANGELASVSCTFLIIVNDTLLPIKAFPATGDVLFTCDTQVQVQLRKLST